MSNTDTVLNYLRLNKDTALSTAHIAKAVGLTSKQTSSAISRLVKDDKVKAASRGLYVLREEPTAPDQGQADRTGLSAREKAVEDLSQAAEISPEEAEQVVDEATEKFDLDEEPIFYESIDFPGNYSIAFVPFALGIAEAAGVPAKSENLKGSLTRRVHFGGDDMDRAKAVLDYIRQESKAALESLKVWQKETRAERKDLTDMQKYLQHRDHITAFGEKVAIKIAREGL